MPRLPRNLHLVTLCAALTMRFAENTQHDTSKVLFPVLLRTTQLAQITSKYYFVLQSLHKVSQYYFVLQNLHKILPSTTSYYKTCTKYFPILPSPTSYYKSQYYFVLQNHFPVLLRTTKLAQITSYDKACTKYFPVLLRTTKLAQSTSQCNFPELLRTTKLAQSTSQYYFVLQSLHKVFPSTTSYYKACTKYFPVYCKACTKYVPVLLRTTKLAQSTSQCYFPELLRTTKLAQNTSQYYFVLQNLHKTLRTTKLAQSTSQYYFVLKCLHKVRPSTTSYSKACTQNFPVLLCTTKLAQSTSQYYFVLKNLHKVLPSTTFVLPSWHKVLHGTTSYYKTCTKYFPVLLGTTKLAASKSTFSYEFSYGPTSKSTFRARLPSIFITCHKMPRLPRNLHLVTLCAALTMRFAATRHVESAAPATKNAEGYLQNAALATTK